MRDRLITFLFWVQGALCAASSGDQLERPSTDPSATLWDGPWHLLGGDWLACVIGSCHWGHPLCCPPPPGPDPNLQTPRWALVWRVLCTCRAHCQQVVPSHRRKATLQQKGFVRPGPQGKPTHSIGFSPFVSRLKTWPSPPLSLKQPSQHFCSAITFSF